MEKFATKVIEWSFYLLFLLVPLVFFSGSFELFEYNKMMLTYGFSVIITAAWLIKIVASRQPLFKPLRWIKRTPFDLPIIFYLLSHLISTVVSIDPHVSVWGYYSRFHEGLMASLSYIILYYAAVSNLKSVNVLRILTFSFIAAVIVSLWGTLEHFGASPSCLFITHQFNNSCWIQDVTNRVFATLGQPNWMAAYLDTIILILLGLLFPFSKLGVLGEKAKEVAIKHVQWKYLALLGLCFAALLFTKSRSGLLGLGIGSVVYFTLYFSYNVIKKSPLPTKEIGMTLAIFVFIAFIFGVSVPSIDRFSLPAIIASGQATSLKPANSEPRTDFLISESGDIRKVVWDGAIKVWQRYPLFGSGVETFAYSYYLDRPSEHNLLSEWDFLYNKAHNEFLNILATTGTVGMLAYLALIGAFLLWFIRELLSYSKTQKSISTAYGFSLIVGLFAAYVSLLVTNFFGFSVVIVGLFFFLIPAFSLILQQEAEQNGATDTKSLTTPSLSSGTWMGIIVLSIAAFILLSNLYTMWSADKSFAYGKNLDGINEFVSGYPYLVEAVKSNSSEPTFRDELSYNEAVLAALVFKTVESQATASGGITMDTVIPSIGLSGRQLITSAINDSNTVVESAPNSMPFWKTRTKLFYQLATIDRNYLGESLNAIKKATVLAPTDAKVHYNYALILVQMGQVPDAITVLEKTIALKPDYRDALFQLGTSYELITEHEKARIAMKEIVKRDSKDEEAKKWLEEHP